MAKGYCPGQGGRCLIKLNKGEKLCKRCRGYHKEPVYKGASVIPSGWRWVKD